MKRRPTAFLRSLGLAVLLTTLLIAELLVVPSSETRAQGDALDQLHAMTEIHVVVFGQMYLNWSTRNVAPSADPPFSPLVWDGTRFSTEYSYRAGDYNHLVTFEGEVSPEGPAVMTLKATADQPGPAGPWQGTLEMSGPLQLQLGEPYGDGVACYRADLSGSQLNGVLQSYDITAHDTHETLPSADSLDYIVVEFCQGPQGQPAATSGTGLWQFQSREVEVPSPDEQEEVNGYVCAWTPTASVGDSSVRVSLVYVAPYCTAMDTTERVLETTCSWTPPARQLYVGDSVALSTSVDNVTVDGGPVTQLPPDRGGAAALLTAYIPEAGADFQICSAHWSHSDPEANSLPQTGSASWQVPAGQPGQSMMLIAHCYGAAAGGVDIVTVTYHYEYVELDKTPEPDDLTTDEAPIEEEESDASPEEDDTVWSLPEQLEEIIAGLGDIGNIPGPEGLAEALVGIGLPAAVISALAALGYLAGGGYTDDVSAPPGGPPEGPPGAMTLTDALGNQHHYDWDPEQGGYINPQTGGMLNPTLWEIYNSNLAANRAFSDRERQRLENRETYEDRRANWTQTDRARERREGLEGALRNLEARGYRLGEDGARASAHAAQLARQARSGKPVSMDKALAIERFIHNRETGRTMADTGDRGEVTNWDVYQAQAQGWARAVVTGRNEDGSTNWAGLGTRIGIALVSGGSSEYALIPASAAYNYSDYRERGWTRSEAAAGAVGWALAEAAIGKAVQGAVGLGGKALGTAGQFADEVAPGLSNYVRTGFRGLKGEFGQLARGASAAKQTLARRLGLGGQPALSAAEKQMQWRVTKAVAEEADDDLVRIFRGDGRQTLGALERNGGLTQHQAGRIRHAISTQVDGALDDGATAAMQRFRERTGIQPEEVLVGDSGSTARGGAFSAGNTDFDRTVVPRFAQSDITRYATENGISEEQAVEVLSRRFRATYQREVGQALNQRTGLTTGEVDLNIFDRVQPGTGPGGDIYPFGYTNARQSAWGRTRVYRPGHRPYNTSGDALVDQNVIEIGRAGHPVPADPVRMNPAEFRAIIRRQAAAGNRATDATSLAKALERASEPMRRLRVPNTSADTQLSRIARQIRNNPQQQAEILRSNGLTEQQFVERARAELNQFASLTPD